MSVKEKIVITCDGSLLVDYEKNIATFKDNVRVEKPDMVIYSDIMDIYFTASKEKVESIKTNSMMNDKIDKIVARGHVKIVRGENISYSDEATYSALDKKMILSGRPKIILYYTEDFKNASFGN